MTSTNFQMSPGPSDYREARVVPLVFVYKGNEIPSYGKHALKLARRQFEGDIFLLTDSKTNPDAPGIRTVGLHEFYDESEFENFRTTSPLDPLFRGGFSLLATERFFVLEQFMLWSGLDAILHTELDVVVFQASAYLDQLDSFGKGLFTPVVARDRAIASFFYVNDISALRKLNEFITERSDLGNEMLILGNFFLENPSIAHALPCEAAYSDGWPFTSSAVPSELGIVDAAAFGQWVLGEDPRNSVKSTWNHYEDNPATSIQGFRFRASFDGRKLSVERPVSPQVSLHALHIHSKVFGRLNIYGLLALIGRMSSLPFRIPVTVKPGSWARLLLKIVLAPKIQGIFSKLNPRFRNALGLALIYLGNKSPQLLSNRQRNLIMSCLPNHWTPRDSLEVTDVRYAEKLKFKLRDDVADLLKSFSDSDIEDYRASISIFLDAVGLEDEGLIYTTGSEPGYAVTFTPQRQPLFASGVKDYGNAQHARGFWKELDANIQWSFSGEYQLIQPRIVRMMFPEGETDIWNWAIAGLNRPNPSLSAFQSYGIWLISNYPNRVKILAPILS